MYEVTLTDAYGNDCAINIFSTAERARAYCERCISEIRNDSSGITIWVEADDGDYNWSAQAGWTKSRL